MTSFGIDISGDQSAHRIIIDHVLWSIFFPDDASPDAESVFDNIPNMIYWIDSLSTIFYSDLPVHPENMKNITDILGINPQEITYPQYLVCKWFAFNHDNSSKIHKEYLGMALAAAKQGEFHREETIKQKITTLDKISQTQYKLPVEISLLIRQFAGLELMNEEKNRNQNTNPNTRKSQAKLSK